MLHANEPVIVGPGDEPSVRLVLSGSHTNSASGCGTEYAVPTVNVAHGDLRLMVPEYPSRMGGRSAASVRVWA